MCKTYRIFYVGKIGCIKEEGDGNEGENRVSHKKLSKYSSCMNLLMPDFHFFPTNINWMVPKVDYSKKLRFSLSHLTGTFNSVKKRHVKFYSI